MNAYGEAFYFSAWGCEMHKSKDQVCWAIKIFRTPGWVRCFMFLFCHSELPQKGEKLAWNLKDASVFFACVKQKRLFSVREEFVENWVMAAKRGHPLILAWQALFNGYWNSKSRHSGRDRDGQCWKGVLCLKSSWCVWGSGQGPA